MNIQVTGIEALVCQEIARRQRLGIQKYGLTVADNPLALIEWVRHAKEEALDLAVYLTKLQTTLEAQQLEDKPKCD
jgi:hypothetical protein